MKKKRKKANRETTPRTVHLASDLAVDLAALSTKTGLSGNALIAAALNASYFSHEMPAKRAKRLDSYIAAATEAHRSRLRATQLTASSSAKLRIAKASLNGHRLAPRPSPKVNPPQKLIA